MDPKRVSDMCYLAAFFCNNEKIKHYRIKNEK